MWSPYGSGMGGGAQTQADSALERARIAANASVQNTQTNANALEDAAQLRSPGAIVPSGVPGQFRRVDSDVAGGHLADAVAAGTTFGTPTAFNGGAGAPQPVEVVRGTKTTYTNPAPDTGNGGYAPTASRNTQEFATPVQANQAFNRGSLQDAMGAALGLSDVVPPGSPAGTLSPRGQALADAADKYGGYQEPRTDLANAQIGALNAKAAADTAATDNFTLNQNRARFQQQALPALGVKNLDDLKKDPEKYNLFVQHLDLAGKDGPQTALAKLQDTMSYNRWDKQFTPDNVNTVRTAEGLAPLPAESDAFKTPAPGDANGAIARQSMVRQYGPYFDKHLNQNGLLGTIRNILPMPKFMQ